MKLKALPSDVDPAEAWLGARFLGDSFSTKPPEEASRALKFGLRSMIAERLEAEKLMVLRVDPIQFGEMFSGLHFDVVERPVSADHAGALAPRPNGFSVVVNPGLGTNRRRFTLAHEVGHSFFYDWTAAVPTLRFRSSRYWVQEGYASEIARDILLPERMLLEQQEALDEPSLANLHVLSDRFGVSPDVLRRRLVEDLRLWDCILFQSRLSAGIVTTSTADISKGHSFRRLRVPRNMSISDMNRTDEFIDLLRESIRSGHSIRAASGLGGNLEAWTETQTRDGNPALITLVRASRT
jgi:hypothetical protein